FNVRNISDWLKKVESCPSLWKRWQLTHAASFTGKLDQSCFGSLPAHNFSPTLAFRVLAEFFHLEATLPFRDEYVNAMRAVARQINDEERKDEALNITQLADEFRKATDTLIVESSKTADEQINFENLRIFEKDLIDQFSDFHSLS